MARAVKFGMAPAGQPRQFPDHHADDRGPQASHSPDENNRISPDTVRTAPDGAGAPDRPSSRMTDGPLPGAILDRGCLGREDRSCAPENAGRADRNGQDFRQMGGA